MLVFVCQWVREKCLVFERQNAMKMYIMYSKNEYYQTHIMVPMGFPSSSAGKESTCNAGGLGSIPGLGRSPGEGNCYPLQYSGLENSMDSIVHEVAELDTTEQL